MCALIITNRPSRSDSESGEEEQLTRILMYIYQVKATKCQWTWTNNPSCHSNYTNWMWAYSWDPSVVCFVSLYWRAPLPSFWCRDSAGNLTEWDPAHINKAWPSQHPWMLRAVRELCSDTFAVIRALHKDANGPVAVVNCRCVLARQVLQFQQAFLQLFLLNLPSDDTWWISKVVLVVDLPRNRKQ